MNKPSGHLGVCSAVLALCLAGPTLVSAQSCPDVAGFAPLDGVPVYDGACLFGADDPGFALFALPTGPMKAGAPETSIALEGAMQRRLYVAPDGASPTDVYVNYRDALLAQGFEPLFACSGRDCGSNNALLGKLVIYPIARHFSNLGEASTFALYIDGDEHYLAARSGDGQRHIAVYVARNQSGSITGAAAGRAAVHVDLVTTGAVQTRMVDAAAMAKGIADDGHIAIENVYFDFGTADLTLEAAPALAEMVSYLAANPEVSVFIVGHTDGVGDADANLILSQDRAAAVVAALAADGIPPSRITAAGVGPFAPRATNATDAGRTLNRRVELVER
ncbi:Outer membrane protein OmpA [Loktanella fryxellensis]|uniref:Outer membrane protein OmpA n=1 Tax=Loktanella fryxellensis TaxID=245187 RepID=A0A1H8C2P0_9RHOB|nr:OmpA family protein [Loktanella fryxellensis]SEM89119.1 Outer membrane protein OmpA [Loktanella fryxellensis]